MLRIFSFALFSHAPLGHVGKAAPASAAVRSVSSANGSRKKKRHETGYDALLQQARAAHSKQQRAKRHKHEPGAQHSSESGNHKGPFSFGFAAGAASSSSGHAQARAARRAQRSSGKAHSSERWKGWAEEPLHRSGAGPGMSADEFHNLFFMEGPGTSHASNRRRRRKAVRQRQRAAGRGWHGAWASAQYVEWDGESDDDEYGFAFDDGQHEAAPHWQQQRRRAGAYDTTADWKWWTDHDEREWFEQAWQQKTGKSGWRNAYQQEQQQQQHHHHHQQRQQEQQQQQQQQQQHQRHWEGHYKSWWQNSQSRNSHQQQGRATTSTSAAVLEHLKVLGLQHDAVLERPLLKSAFHKAAMAWHPDRHSDSTAKRAAEEQFKRAQEAYESLLVHAV